LETSQNKLDKRYQQLLAIKQQREKTLQKILASLKSGDSRLKKLINDRRELEKLIQSVEQAIINLKIPSEYQAFSKRQGKMPWPVKGRLQNRFGTHRQGHLKWDGLMIKTSPGTIVKAIHHGRVVFADWLRGQGLLIILDHGDGYMSLYAHSEVLLKDLGDWVVAGEPIARAGNSGGLSESGLYFEIRKNGRPINPRRWCSRL
jgi:septal ring factor EnvC (AmiA/AmiB activator)